MGDPDTQKNVELKKNTTRCKTQNEKIIEEKADRLHDSVVLFRLEEHHQRCQPLPPDLVVTNELRRRADQVVADKFQILVVRAWHWWPSEIVA